MVKRREGKCCSRWKGQEVKILSFSETEGNILIVNEHRPHIYTPSNQVSNWEAHNLLLVSWMFSSIINPLSTLLQIYCKIFSVNLHKGTLKSFYLEYSKYWISFENLLTLLPSWGNTKGAKTSSALFYDKKLRDVQQEREVAIFKQVFFKLI